jgi:hypothetical protein
LSGNSAPQKINGLLKIIVVRALKDLIRQKAIKPEQVKEVERAMNDALAGIEKPRKAFELVISDEEIERLVKEQEKNK